MTKFVAAGDVIEQPIRVEHRQDGAGGQRSSEGMKNTEQIDERRRGAAGGRVAAGRYRHRTRTTEDGTSRRKCNSPNMLARPAASQSADRP